MTPYSLASDPSSGRSSPTFLLEDSNFPGGPISDSELGGDGDSPWEYPALGPDPSEYGFSSEGEATDFTGDDGNVSSLASSRQPSPLDYIASSAEAVNDRWDTAVPTEGHTSLHPSSSAFAPSIATTLPGSPGQQSEVGALGTPSRAADGGKTISSVPGPKTTPVAKKFSTMQTSSSFEDWQGRERLRVLRKEYASEMNGRIARIEVDTFMREFAPGLDLPEDIIVDAFDRDKFFGTEAPIYGELLKVADSVFSNVTDDAGKKTFVAKDTHGFSDPFENVDGGFKRAPDVVVYPNNKDAAEAYTLPQSALSKHLKTFKSEEDKEAETETVGRTVWHWAALLFEVKCRENDSPFANKTEPSSARGPKPANSVPPLPPSSDPFAPSPALRSTSSDIFSPPPAPWTTSVSGALSSDASVSARLRVHLDGGEMTMGQLTEHAFKVMRRGSRLCVFSIFVCRDLAWLLRWDRAGVVVSEAFNLLEQPRILHNFLYRFARMTDEQRGLDPTVAFASAEEVALLRSPPSAGIETQWQKAAFNNTLQNGWPFYTITMPEADFIPASRLTSGSTLNKTEDCPSPSNHTTRKLIVGMAYFTSDSITGRGTKCYLAYDVTGHRVVFCKEYWRVDLPTSHAEGDVYIKLHQNDVQCIPTPIAAGDVRFGGTASLYTRTQEFMADDGPKLILYRLLLKEIGEPLERYRNSRQLVNTLSLCVTAHEQAWTRAKVLHRDISVNNILIYRYYRHGKLHWLALLVDWAFCKYEHELSQAIVQKTRSGTWHFMSAVLLVFPGHFQHSVWHDLESFIHVLHWMCLRFHLTNYTTTRNLRKRVCDLYTDAYRGEDGVSYGGDAKLEMLLEGRIPFQLKNGSVGRRKGLYSLLVALSKLYKEHYAWLKLPTKVDAEVCPRPRIDAMQDTEEPVEEEEVPFIPSSGSSTPSDDDAIDDSEPPSHPPSEPPKPVLDHAHVHRAFRSALKGADKWTDDPKSHDRFTMFGVFDRHSAGAKRRSDGSSEQKEKRPRQASQSVAGGANLPHTAQLDSIGE